jgi:hypothetical protein
MNEWIKNNGLYTMKYYSATNKDEILSFAGKEMDGTEGHHVEWHKSNTEREVSHVFPICRS